MNCALLAPFRSDDRTGIVTLGVDGSITVEHEGPSGMDGAMLKLEARVAGYWNKDQTPLTLAGLRDEERLDALKLLAKSFAALVEYESAGQTLRGKLPEMIEEEDCPSCEGYGHFSFEGRPTMDGRDRKCLDCRGTGSIPVRVPK